MALTDNLQGYWKMDEASGNLVDETANSNDLTTAGAPTYQQTAGAPDSDYSILYDGVDDNHYSGVNPTGLVITGNLSIQCWINQPVVDGTVEYLCGRYDNNNQKCYVIWTHTGLVIFRVSSDGAAESDTNTGVLMIADTWYHIVCTYDGAYLRIYVDGSLEAGPTAYSSGIFGSTNSKFGIGCIFSGGTATGFANAYIDDVAVWNRVITSAEALELHTYGMSGTPISATKSLIARNTVLKTGSKNL